MDAIEIDTILFDWDGTLIDTAQPAFAAFRKSFRDLGIPLEFDTYERIYSPNWYSMYAQLGLPREKWKQADDLWLGHYASEACTLMPGGEAVLSELARRNFALGIVTSGTRPRVLREIESLGLADAFKVVICNEDVVNKKPHPEGLEAAMRQIRKPPESCCYVGDMPDDIEMGRRAGVLTVGIPSRYPASKKLPASRPDLCFASLEQFLACLKPEGTALQSRPAFHE